MKYFFYEDTILNANQLILIKQLDENCIEMVFENNITWYVLADSHKFLLNEIKLFLMNRRDYPENILDVQKASDSAVNVKIK